VTAALDYSFEKREARAEKVTCVVWLCVIVSTYAFFVLGYGDSISARLVWMINMLVAVMVPAFGLIILMINRGLYSPSLKYVNTFLQVTLVSAAVLFDGLTQGPAYAFSSMPPMAYALVPMITAFRLQPMLGLFAGAVSSFEFLVIYLYLIPPDALLIREIPSLGFEVAMMKACVLLALGVASAFAARSLQDYFVKHGKAQEMRIRLQRNFGRFVAREIVEQIEQSEEGNIAPSLHRAVIVFGDIRGFTAFSETVSPEEATRVLNEFFESVCRIVEREGGMVNKFLGDGYLALFGIYSSDTHPCDSAARAVLAIERSVAGLLEPLGLRPGAAANFGSVVAGEVGSKGRCEFTVIGQPVNLTARVEGLNGALGTSFLATTAFVEHLDGKLFQVSPRGSHGFKGITAPVDVFEIQTG
jgi:adenylate cyclase